MTRTKPPFSVQLTDAQWAKLRAHCETHGLRQTDAVRQALALLIPGFDPTFEHEWPEGRTFPRLRVESIQFVAGDLGKVTYLRGRGYFLDDAFLARGSTDAMNVVKDKLAARLK